MNFPSGFFIRFLVCIYTITLFIACKKDKPKAAPSVTTALLINVTSSTATAGGGVSDNGNDAVKAAGIVLSRIHTTPTLADTVVATTTTSGTFTVNLTNLEFNTTYYIRAYATNSIGTGYGNVVTLNTTNDTSKIRFTYNGVTVTYGIIISSKTGKKWMDRNLGAGQVGTSATDALAYGDLFQWGRLADGHQLRSSATVNTRSSSDVPGHDKFIMSLIDPWLDWRNPQNSGLWQGVGGINNPCPVGWRVPTRAEWNAELPAITNISSAFSALKLTLAGTRWLDGSFSDVGKGGYYWSSTSYPTDGNTGNFGVDNSGTWTGRSDRGNGLSVRCIKD